MGSRGPRSASDMAFIQPHQTLTPINVEAMVRSYGNKREVMRSLRRAERQGQVICKLTADGVEEWLSITP